MDDDSQRRYFFLDRDGVINHRAVNAHALSSEQFEFLPRALEALRLLATHHYVGIVISRQTRAGEGPPTPNELDRATRKLLLEVALAGGHIARVYYCRHRKESGCDCYRPNVGLIARASADHGFLTEEAHFVSEDELDLQSAAAAGCSCIRIQRDAFLQAPVPSSGPYYVASNLYEAAEHVLASTPAHQREYAYDQTR
ncbi:MAG TPA: hypothetical protein VGI46_07190 [Candidatus Acidoferrum sp.]